MGHWPLGGGPFLLPGRPVLYVLSAVVILASLGSFAVDLRQAQVGRIHG